ncbi:MAG: hypothetical protein ABEJ56_03455 [Candidatus Nanohaloarchaea archaeon]
MWSGSMSVRVKTLLILLGMTVLYSVSVSAEPQVVRPNTEGTSEIDADTVDGQDASQLGGNQNLSEVLGEANKAGTHDINLTGNAIRDVSALYDDSNTQCGSDEFLNGQGSCTTDSFATDTDNQNLEDVLAQYNDAGAYNINLSGSEIQDTDGAITLGGGNVEIPDGKLKISNWNNASGLNATGAPNDFSNAGDLGSSGDITDGNVENAELNNNDVSIAGNTVNLGGSVTCSSITGSSGLCDSTDNVDDSVSDSNLEGAFSSNGFLKRTSSNTYSTDSTIDISGETNLGSGNAISISGDNVAVSESGIGHDNIGGVSTHDHISENGIEADIFDTGDNSPQKNLGMNNDDLANANSLETNNIYDNDDNKIKVKDNISLATSGGSEVSEIHTYNSGESGVDIGLQGGKNHIEFEHYNTPSTDFLTIDYNGGSGRIGAGANLDMNNNDVDAANQINFNGGAYIDEGAASYGSIRVSGSCDNGYCGVNIQDNEDYVFMTSGDTVGIYDDSDNNWVWDRDDSQNVLRVHHNLEVTGSIDETADVAEVMRQKDKEEEIEAGDVVAIKEGKVTKNTTDSSLNMVVSAKPGIRLGGQVAHNISEDTREMLEEKRLDIAFTGRVPVKVRGEAESGDYLLPSGENDGTAVAVDEKEISFQQYRRAIGVVLQPFEVPEHMSKNNTEEYREVLEEAEKKPYTIYNVAVGVK